jgi:AAA15 family ATPase/GTPase
MLLEFSVGNFMSFRDTKTLSMVASAIKEHADKNVFKIEIPNAKRAKEINLLKSSVIYGANASGKSNLIKAISFMKYFVLSSSTAGPVSDEIPVDRFLLDSEKDKEPSFFEIIFTHKCIRYRYGFEVNRMEVVNEWLFYAPKGKEALLFMREGKNFKIGSNFREGKGLKEKTRENALFLSVTAQFNGKISTNILQWFKQKLRIISGLDDKKYADFTLKKIKSDEGKNEILKFLAIADLGIDDIKLIYYDIDDDEVPSFIKKDILRRIKLKRENKVTMEQITEVFKIVSSRDKYDKDKIKCEKILFEFGNESEGTKKLFALSGLLTSALKEGYVLVVDELDSRFHPMMTRFIIELFNSNVTNQANSQLIFVTHDTNLLTKSLFRRDQIWFTEKNRYGATDLYSLVDYRVRSDATFSKDYILGKYGAIPFIGDPKKILDS